MSDVQLMLTTLVAALLVGVVLAVIKDAFDI